MARLALSLTMMQYLSHHGTQLCHTDIKKAACEPAAAFLTIKRRIMAN
ncbi:hypothetical protein NAC44_00600 [Allorhizobium sp. BGMRC 0089]|nr:hypothetical protein [Allorhizobium sonneratiae]MCM2290826.1 hypothetical protein [Allorhizobium sonneratiae]